MVRPKKFRRVLFEPDVTYFKPAGIKISELDEVKLSIDEVEAMRLCNLEGLSQSKAAKKMKVSQPTLHRLINSAEKKVADALVCGKAMRIEGGVYKVVPGKGYRIFKCSECGASWQRPFGTGPEQSCPECESENVRRKE